VLVIEEGEEETMTRVTMPIMQAEEMNAAIRIKLNKIKDVQLLDRKGNSFEIQTCPILKCWILMFV